MTSNGTPMTCQALTAARIKHVVMAVPAEMTPTFMKNSQRFGQYPSDLILISASMGGSSPSGSGVCAFSLS